MEEIAFPAEKHTGKCESTWCLGERRPAAVSSAQTIRAMVGDEVGSTVSFEC